MEEYNLRDLTVNSGYYIDYPPAYNSFNQQHIERDVDVAISMILRLFYCKINTLPGLPGLFIDIERYKHILANEQATLDIRDAILPNINATIGKMNPLVEVSIDPINMSLYIQISMFYNKNSYIIRFNKAEDFNKLRIDINKKPFYD